MPAVLRAGLRAPTSPACRRGASRDGDEWIVNGQKVWTTLAHVARWGLLVVRTDPDGRKHAGLTAFVVDMHGPGVEVRPLRQMTGEAEFNEVYFTDTRIPDSERLGKPGDGWRVSLTTLMNERVSIGGAIAPKGSGPIGEAVKIWQALPAERKDAATKRRADEALDRGRGQPAHQHPGLAEPQDGRPRARRARSASWPSPSPTSASTSSPSTSWAPTACSTAPTRCSRPETAMASDSVQKAFLRSRANSIEGGTSEVMRNILGERVLGLPGDVRVDREVAWKDVPRN